MICYRGLGVISEDNFPVSNFKPAFDRALVTEDTERANTIAMLAADHFLNESLIDVQKARTLLWEHFFRPLSVGYKVQYQSSDFESTDYQLYCVFRGMALVRGPQPPISKLVRGQYVTLFGAAQLFGRHQQVSPHSFFEENLDVGAVNLSVGGAGPETFLRKKYIRIANRGKAVVLQVLSGRSIGCDEYPGRRLAHENGNEEAEINRLELLRRIWGESRNNAIRLVQKWQQNYLDAFQHLAAKIEVPIILAWISDRTPDSWSVDMLTEKRDFGRFPHLVDRRMLNIMAARSTAVVEVSEDGGLPHGFVNRFTGEKCPSIRPKGAFKWENKYYPSQAGSAKIGKKITDALESTGLGG